MWLSELLNNGTLLDNSLYKIKNRILTNRRLDPITLDRKASRKNWTSQNNNAAVWNFLNAISQELNNGLSASKQHGIVLFNEKEYEHNTSDPLFYLTGKDAENFSLKTGNLIGYVKKGHYALKISSRFGDDFLKYIIADADGFLELDNLGGESHREGYEWLLAYLWNIKFKRAYRLGLPKRYVTKREHLSNVRGKIDVVDFFQNSTSGKYLCTYREHSYQSIANALFIKAYQSIKDFSFCHSTRNIYNALLIANEGNKYTHQALMQTPYFTNPFYNDYNVLIDISKKVINQTGANFDSVHDAKAFLFDISMLFEYFIRKLLIRNNISLLSKSERKYQIPTGVENKHNLEPDIVFERDGGMYVFDVKYKSFDFRYGVNREDLFQLHTYIGQYGNDACIKGCGFIYPISEARWDEVQNQLNTSNAPVIMQHGKAIPFHVLFLKIPNSDSGNFNQKMNEECRNFMNSFFQMLLINV